MLEIEVLIVELVAVDGLPAGAVVVREVPVLAHGIAISSRLVYRR